MIKILQLTDLHFGVIEDPALDMKTQQLITRLISKVQPDLIAVTGDLVWSLTQDSLHTYSELLAFINQFDVPFAVTFGNHDSEGEYGRDVLIAQLQEQSNFIDMMNAEVIMDRLNYFIELEDEGISHRLYFMDSGDYDVEQFGEYAYIYLEQIEWLVNQERDYEGVSQLFIHIPLPEYADAKRSGLAEGHQDETVCAPVLNTGLFSALFFQTSVQSVYCGHDHDNDFTADYHGIRLNYGRVTGYNTYGELNRGGRVIEMEGSVIKSYIVE
ncbi:metallophosphoesterase family protein [Macrococcus bovicus]|uniref:metallophosphoesterase family protein n=1 Tax=Macrococcus bovicus TaxID=69968 RepID=UPI0025A5C913|nr:metallophosphoesterase family protein [Macrococcus bovicus]WJP97380.1 metallophosphoesterase family protein [Macrococcus bovicus]